MSDPLPHDLAQALIRRAFPDAELVAIEPFPGAHENQTCDLEIRNPTMNVAIKVYQNPVDQEPWKEARLLELLTSETGVPVPRVLHFDDSGALLPQPWILYTRLPGQPLSDVIDEMDEWALGAIGYEMGRYLAHIHQIPLETFGDPFAGQEGTFEQEKDFVLDLADRCLMTCIAAQSLQPAQADHIRRVFETTTVLNQAQACLIHGDYIPDNIIVEFSVTDFHITGVLDLAQATGSSPEHDMSRLFNLHFQAAPSLQKGFLDGYTESAEIKAHFWERIKVYRLLSYLEQTARLCAQDAAQPRHAQLTHTLSSFAATFAQ